MGLTLYTAKYYLKFEGKVLRHIFEVHVYERVVVNLSATLQWPSQLRTGEPGSERDSGADCKQTNAKITMRSRQSLAHSTLLVSGPVIHRKAR